MCSPRPQAGTDRLRHVGWRLRSQVSAPPGCPRGNTSGNAAFIATVRLMVDTTPIENQAVSYCSIRADSAANLTLRECQQSVTTRSLTMTVEHHEDGSTEYMVAIAGNEGGEKWNCVATGTLFGATAQSTLVTREWVANLERSMGSTTYKVKGYANEAAGKAKRGVGKDQLRTKGAPRRKSRVPHRKPQARQMASSNQRPTSSDWKRTPDAAAVWGAPNDLSEVSESGHVLERRIMSGMSSLFRMTGAAM